MPPIAVVEVVELRDQQLLSYLYANPQKWRDFNQSSSKIATKIYKFCSMIGLFKNKKPVQTDFFIIITSNQSGLSVRFQPFINFLSRHPKKNFC